MDSGSGRDCGDGEFAVRDYVDCIRGILTEGDGDMEIAWHDLKWWMRYLGIWLLAEVICYPVAEHWIQRLLLIVGAGMLASGLEPAAGAAGAGAADAKETEGK